MRVFQRSSTKRFCRRRAAHSKCRRRCRSNHDLEEPTSARLLHRTTRRLSLSVAGGDLHWQRMRAILEDIDEAHSNAASSQTASLAAGVLRVLFAR